MLETPRVEEREPTEVILAAARSGDREAWKKIDQRYRRLLALLVRNQVPPEQRGTFDEDDLLQSTFLAAFRALDNYQYHGPGSFLSWLTTILLHRLQSKLRGSGPPNDGPVSQAPCTASTPSELMGRAERQARLLQAVAALPGEQRAVVELCYFDRRTYVQAAEVLGISEKTVARRLAAGLRNLRVELEGER